MDALRAASVCCCADRARSPPSSNFASSFSCLTAPFQKRSGSSIGRRKGSRSLSWRGDCSHGALRATAVVRASVRGDDNRDDAGVVKDMEVYLDNLSLEYDSVWDTKPAW